MLILARLRRERIQLPIWILATALLALASSAGVQTEYETEAAREQVLALAIATPSLLVLRGLPDGASLGAFVYFQVFTYLAIMAALMSTFFVTRNTRADEERGALELVAASPVRRWAPLAATIAVGAAANVLLGMAVTLGMLAGGLPATGCLVAGLAVASVGLVFVALGALVAQVAPTGRAANGITAALVGIAFLLRAVGDATGTPRLDALTVESAWPSWLSPIGWGQHVFAFSRPDLAPLLLALALAVVASGLALALQSRRDLGASALRSRPGRAMGTIRTGLGLAWREQWPSLIGWLIGAAVTGLLAGRLALAIAGAEDVARSIQELMDRYMGGTGQLTDLLVAAVVGIAGILAAAAGAQAVMRARSEEADGRAELVLAAPASRTRWLLGYVLVGAVSAASVGLVAGIAAGLSFVADDPDRVWSSIAAGVAQVPAALTFVALTALVLVLLPRLTIVVAWALLALAFVLGQFGGLLQLPEGARDLSPFTHTPEVPVGGADWSAAWVLLAITAVGIALAAVVMRRRELTV